MSGEGWPKVTTRHGVRIEDHDGIEVRYAGDELDEVVAENAHVHLEKMDEGRWWLAVMIGDRRVCVNLGVVNPRAKTYAFVETD